MSVMCCVYVPEGIILAADSRLTQTKSSLFPQIIKQGEKEINSFSIKETVYTLSDNAQKVILMKKNNVGISFCGNATINGLTVADYLRKFEIDKIQSNDSTENTAKKLSECGIGSGTIFFVCGFDNDIPYVYSVCDKEISRLNVISKKLINEKPIIQACEDTEKLELGKPAIINIEQQNENDNKKEKTQELEIHYGAHWGGKQLAITKLVNGQPVLITSYHMMPLKDAIDFAEFLIDLTIKYERFSDDIQTCGGDIDVLVITKDNAFWKQHKVYNPAN